MSAISLVHSGAKLPHIFHIIKCQWLMATLKIIKFTVRMWRTGAIHFVTPYFNCLTWFRMDVSGVGIRHSWHIHGVLRHWHTFHDREQVSLMYVILHRQVTNNKHPICDRGICQTCPYTRQSGRETCDLNITSIYNKTHDLYIHLQLTFVCIAYYYRLPECVCVSYTHWQK